VAGGEGGMTLMGIEDIGTCNSSSSEDIGLRWLGFLCLDCFSEFRWHFRAFMPSITRIVCWKRSRDGAITAGDAVGGAGEVQWVAQLVRLLDWKWGPCGWHGLVLGGWSYLESGV